MNLNPISWFKKEAPKAAPELMTDIAWSHSSLYAGTDFAKYNPDDLVGRKGLGIYQRMMVDEQIKAVVRFKRDAITSRAHLFACEYEEELGEEECEHRCEVFEAAVCRMTGSFADALNSVMSSMYMGFSLTEKVFMLIDIDGKQWYGIKYLRLKPHDSFYFYVDQYGNVLALKQKMFGTEIEVDQAKFIHYVQNPEWDQHYGRSELRECYRAWWSKDITIRMQNIHLERYAGGFVWARPVAGKTLNANTTEYTNLQSVLENIHAKTSMIVPANVELNVVQGATTDMYEKAVAQHDKSIAKSLLVPNLLGVSEQGQHGSLAQADSQLEAFLWTLEADTKRLEDCLNEQLFRDLGDLNFGDGKYPKFKFAPISNKAKMTLISTWKDLVTAGAVEASDTDEMHLRELLDMPEKGEPLKQPAPEGDMPKVDPETGLPMDPETDEPMGPKAVEETIIGKLGISISAFRKMFGYNPDQPRDDAGRFGDGGGGTQQLTGREQYAIDNYTSTGYNDINRKLRSGNTEQLSPSQKEQVATLDRLIARGELAGSVTVYRVIDGKRAGDKYLEVGAVISDPAFLSTSMDEQQAIRAVNDTGARLSTMTTLEIQVPKGAHALDIGAGSHAPSLISPRAAESELLLPRETRLEVVSVDTDSRRVTARVVTDASRNTRIVSSTAFSRAMKRVDFAVIASKADNNTQDATYETAAINSQCVARLVTLADELKLGTAEGNPNDIQKIQYTASEMSQLKAAVNKGLKDAWAIGESHAKREIQKAKGGADFAVNDLALQDLAAAYLKQKSYTLAGDISAATQKTIRNILMEGTKNSKTTAEVKLAIYKALEADGMLTEDAVVDALGASTVKNASARIETAIKTTSFEAINEARYSFFSDPALNGFVEALEYSAILDDRTTEICSQLNGETFGIDDAVWSTFRPPNHFNCRSLLIPVTIRDTWTQSDEPTVNPQKGFGFDRGCKHK